MKKILFIFSSAILLSFVCTKLFYTEVLSKTIDHKKSAKKTLDPNERMLLQRSYPDKQFDFIAFHKAQMKVYNTNFKNQTKSISSLTWNVEGPGNIGGRFNCLAVHPTNSNIIYAGAATGGIFKTTDGGTTWSPIFDNQPYLAIGSITIDANNPNTIWVGTGDANISGLCYIGDGIYKSTDGGNTWTNMGLNDQHVFSKIIIDPTNSNIIYAATMGQPFVRDNNRGLYKSIDGGTTWNSILFVHDDAGIIDLVINPNNTQILYAASYNRIRNNQERLMHGPQSKIWKTTDGGTTWNPLTNGLPNFPVSRIGLTIYPSNPNILYTVIADSTQYFQGIYKTTDGGTSWLPVDITSLDPSCYNGYGWYFGKIYVNPSNSNQIYVLGVDSYTTSNNGLTWNAATPPWYMYIVHGDQHFMHFIDGNTILLCTDGGIYETTDNCINWTDIENIPVNQVYHANENPFVVNDYWCGVQDNGTSNGNQSTINAWNRIYGGDGFQSWIDPTDSTIFYVSTQNGGISYTDNGGSSMYDATTGINPADQRNWDMPYIISKFDHTTLYCGTYQIYKMTGAPYGVWSPISGDLSDGLGTYLDDLHTITTISESSLNADIIYAGTADANVWVTTDGGGSWNDITDTLPNRYVTSVKASPNNANNVYVAHSGYRNNENIPHIHKSMNNGTTWIDISGDLPQMAVNDILITPGAENILYVATDAGVYYTTNGGTNWNRLGNNMPLMPVFDVEFNTAGSKIIASTFARSVQTIDILSITTGIKNNFEKNNFSIFPNPATDYIQIKSDDCSIMNEEKISYTIYSLNGKLIKSNTGIKSNLLTISVSDLAKGTYLIQIERKNQTFTKRFVKM